MEPLDQLYREIIIDHSRQPHNYGLMSGSALQLEGFNPLCGDRFTVYVDLDGVIVRDIKFNGQGCAISTASTSIMTDIVKGREVADILQLAERFKQLATGGVSDASLGKAAVFAGVAEFPMRVKCATLSWHTLRRLLERVS